MNWNIRVFAFSRILLRLQYCLCTVYTIFVVAFLDLYSGDLLTTTICFTRNVTSHKTDWILTYYYYFALLCLVLYAISLMKVHELEHSGFHLLENYIASILLFMYCYTQCLWLRSHAYHSIFISYLLLLRLLGRSWYIC